ncbi:MAG: SIS domain-containing protein [Candidatus Limnocylindrales bacterium]|jgi:fructoselysine-6-P-deglycase FrlB-like protein
MSVSDPTARSAASDLSLLAFDGPDEMGRELASGPAVVEATLTGLSRRRGAVVKVIEEAGRVLVLGTGASLAVARCAEPLLRARDTSVGRTRPLVVLEASAAVLGTAQAEAFRPDDCVVAVSKSGVSPEIVGASRLARAAGARVVAVTASETSALAKLAHEVVPVPIGEEHGAATKSALGALAALLGIWDVFERDAPGSRGLAEVMESAVRDWETAWTIGRELAGARRIWFAGFGAAQGAAEAAGLLWHEKVGRSGVSSTPSGFRHGLIEAAGSEDALVILEIDPPTPVRRRYMDLLAGECARIGLKQVWVSHESPPVGQWLALRVEEAPGRALEGLIRVQQLARAAAHAAGTYRDGFAVLRSIVHTSTSYE